MTHHPLVALVASFALLYVAPKFAASNNVVCYFTNWAQYRKCNDAKFFPKDIDPMLCTHIIYAFAKFDGLKVAPFEWNDIDKWQSDKGHYNQVVNHKKNNTDLKVMLAVGGWNEGKGGSGFNSASKSSANRRTFAQNVLAFLKAYDFDGFDNDWEYPALRGNSPESRENNNLMMEEIRTVFDEEKRATGKEYLLSIAVGVGQDTMLAAYDFKRLEATCDFINLMTYDLHGQWDDKTGHQAAIYNDPSEKGRDATLNVEWVLGFILGKGIPSGKLNLGIPCYGRSHQLKNKKDNGLFAPTIKNNASAGRCTAEAGISSYQEICENLKSGIKERWLKTQQGSYYVDGDIWMGYDNPQMTKMKGCLARKYSLGGIMFWALDFDDFNGKFCTGEKYPLINAAKKGYLDPGQDCTILDLEKQRVDKKTPSIIIDYIDDDVIDAINQVAPEDPEDPADPADPVTGVQCTGNGSTADPEDRGKYIQCVNGRNVSKICKPASLIWDDKNGYCNYAELVLKIDDPANDTIDVYDNVEEVPTEAAKRGGVCKTLGDKTADPLTKTMYLECINEAWIPRRCFPNLHFDNSTKECDIPKAGELSWILRHGSRLDPDEPPKTGSLCEPPGDTAADPDTRTKYLECIYGVWISRPCGGGGLHFNPIKKECDYPTSAADENGVTVAPVAGGLCAPPGDTTADNDTRTQYLECVYGAWLSRPCAGGLEFNPIIKNCDWPVQTQINTGTRVVAQGLVMMVMMMMVMVAAMA